MAVNVKSLGRLFGKLNRGEQTLAQLSKSQLSQIDEARDLFRRGEAFEKGSEGYKFFQKEAADYAKNADELIQKAQEQTAIKERVLGNIKNSQNIRATRQFHQIQNEAVSNQARAAQQQAKEDRIRENVRRSQSIRQSKEIDNIYSNAGDVVESLGFNRNEVNQAIHSIKNDRLNPYDISDAELKDMIQDRIYQQRVDRRFNEEYGLRERRRMGERGSHRIKQEMIGEERLADAQRRGVDPTTSDGPSGSSNSGTTSSTGGSGAQEAGGSEGKSSRRSVENASIQKWLGRNFDDRVTNISDALGSGQTLTEGTLRSLGQGVRLAGDDLEDFISLAKGGKAEDALAIARGNRYNYISNPTLGDKMVYHRIPQKGAVVVGGAWLVNNMSASRGQQSNAELYGQQTPYM